SMKTWLAIAVFLAVAAAALAGEAAQQPPAAAGAAASIDPQARALLDQMEAAYRGLASYSGEITVWTGDPAPAPGVRASILVRRPDRAAIEVTGATGVTRVVADGAAIRLLAPGAASPVSENPGDGGAIA